MHRRPIKAIWTGASFVPENADMRYCQHWFGAGEVFVLDPEQERDMNSHKHYFAQLKESWRNLPEGLDAKYPTEDIFRKKLLVECGYFHESEIVCDTVVVRGRVIKKYVAKSQSIAAMGREEFQESKWAVLNFAAALIKVTPKQLDKAAGKSA
jgi:hypothetical protein